MNNEMDKRCEDCLKHLAGDCPGEEAIDDFTSDLNCWQSAEDMEDSDWQEWGNAY